jgi:environmental stress-induced protein Ves
MSAANNSMAMAGWQVVALADVPATPWRNGGGVTRELAVGQGAGVGPDAWAWRMSVAQVDRSGPFSRFDGIERWFAVLQGAGVALDVAGQSQRLTAGDAPFFFDGSAATGCELLDGPTQDFNLMVRRGPLPSRMLRLRDGYVATIDAPKIIAIYAMDTRASVQFHDEVALQLPAATLAWRVLSRPARVQVTAQQALWMEIPMEIPA